MEENENTPRVAKPGEIKAKLLILAGFVIRGLCHFATGWMIGKGWLPESFHSDVSFALASVLIVALPSLLAALWSWRKAVWNWTMIHLARRAPAGTPYSELKQEIKKEVSYATAI